MRKEEFDTILPPLELNHRAHVILQRDVEAAVRDCIEGITAQCCRQEDVPRWSNSFLAVSGVLLQRTTTIVFEVTGEIGGGLGENE